MLPLNAKLLKNNGAGIDVPTMFVCSLAASGYLQKRELVGWPLNS
jgi:hypothetical protein